MNKTADNVLIRSTGTLYLGNERVGTRVTGVISKSGIRLYAADDAVPPTEELAQNSEAAAKAPVLHTQHSESQAKTSEQRTQDPEPQAQEPEQRPQASTQRAQACKPQVLTSEQRAQDPESQAKTPKPLLDIAFSDLARVYPKLALFNPPSIVFETADGNWWRYTDDRISSGMPDKQTMRLLAELQAVIKKANPSVAFSRR
ncbi:hypothetical protein K6V98_05725 [Collinsella sp. AGMB00827]|uniref:Uncharacterized protein n=1 Tax=Collinsella ureilytica TaxID=2869515 RepID=A0ABS7MKF1_9ACTN|nr:hypothetical protein [Collinsella urealyticum]MBY4797849.1 hypothetical protein [Collinsella urealyticum]